MICIIDGDTVAFACAASAEDTEEPWIACGRAKEMLANILKDCETSSYEVWLSGSNNFRYSVYPEYKANRIGAYRPKWEKEVKHYLSDQWGANWSDGCEADDMVGRRLTEVGDNGILAHIDKDLNQITGWHYNWELRRNGKLSEKLGGIMYLLKRQIVSFGISCWLEIQQITSKGFQELVLRKQKNYYQTTQQTKKDTKQS